MIPLPKWIKEVFDKGHCPNCKKSLVAKGVCAVGIREIPPKKKKRMYHFCYDYECVNCKSKTVFTGFPTTLEDYISDLIDIANTYPDSSLKDIELDEEPELIEERSMEATYIPPDEIEEPEEPKKVKKTGMTAKEISDGIRMIDSIEYYEDLLKKLGISKLEPDPENPNESK